MKTSEVIFPLIWWILGNAFRYIENHLSAIFAILVLVSVIGTLVYWTNKITRYKPN